MNAETAILIASIGTAGAGATAGVALWQTRRDPNRLIRRRDDQPRLELRVGDETVDLTRVPADRRQTAISDALERAAPGSTAHALPRRSVSFGFAGLARLVTRHNRWVIAGWLAATAACGALGSDLADKTKHDPVSFLSPSAESSEVRALLAERFPGGATTRGLVVYHRDGRLTETDQEKIRRDVQIIEDAIPVVGQLIAPFSRTSPPKLLNERRDTAYTVVTVPQNPGKTAQWGSETREIVGRGSPAGLETYVTGDLGFSADHVEVAQAYNTSSLVAALLVSLLLVVSFRTPALLLTSAVVLVAAFVLGAGLLSLYADTGNTISSNATSVLVVLTFGVGTNYCLLLITRYREELRWIEDGDLAMERAVRRVGPTLVASGQTVIAAMLVLLLAESDATRSLGLVSAVGVATVLLAALTLLPAMLSGFGRRGFWPHAATVAYDAVRWPRRGLWLRVGHRSLQRPAVTVAASAALLTVLALGLLSFKQDHSIAGTFKEDVESVAGFDLLRESFPAGATEPTAVLIRRERAAPTTRDIAVVRRRVQGVEGVASVTEHPVRSTDAQLVRLDIVFRDDPYSNGSLSSVRTIRERLDGLPSGLRALVGEGSAVQSDSNETSKRDLRLIAPMALLVVAIILAVSLHALVAPVVSILTVVASLLATLGLSAFFSVEVVGDSGVDSSLGIHAFSLLAALWINCTIFVMSRVREEARRLHSTREAAWRTLESPGRVITSTGLLVAGMFSLLMTLPVTYAFNLGFTIATGILLDTFIVRTMMLPAAIIVLGDRVWWPSTAHGGGGALPAEFDEAHHAVPAPARY